MNLADVPLPPPMFHILISIKVKEVETYGIHITTSSWTIALFYRTVKTICASPLLPLRLPKNV